MRYDSRVKTAGSSRLDIIKTCNIYRAVVALVCVNVGWVMGKS
jgi:hypothetical protein